MRPELNIDLIFDLPRGGLSDYEASLRYHDITDSELAEIVDLLPGIKELTLRDSAVTNVGFEHLKRLSGLKRLELYGNQEVRDAALDHVGALTNLRELGLAFTRITDAGVQKLSGMVQLEKLDVRCSRVTDAGLRQLQGLKRLRHLDLAGTHVTDAGLESLRDLPLRHLYLGHTDVSVAGVERLEKELPECEIKQ